MLRLRAAFAVAAAGLALLALAPTPPVHVNAQLAATAPWLSRLNQWRSSTWLPTLTENTTWSAGDYAHGQYMVMNDLVTHYETPGTPYYTTAGDTAARDSNIYVSSSTSTADSQAIDWWMGAPFHAMGMMDPRLTSTGFGSYRYVKSGWQMGAAVDVIRGNSFTGGTFPVEFPGNGSTEPLTSYSGNEFPDPLQACSGYSVPTGLPVFIEVGGNVKTSVNAASITANGVSLPACAIDSNNATVGSYLYARGGVILIPRSPLQNGVTYTVSLTVNGSAYRWSFTVGAFVASPCTSAGLTADMASPQLPGAAITFTATSAGCPNPQYLFNVESPAGVWSVARTYGAPTWTWDTAGLMTGNYVVDVWVRDGASGASWQAYQLASFTLGSGCTITSVAPSVASPQQVGTQVTFTASSSGCGAPEYLFYTDPPGGGWTLMRGYGSATWTWNTATLPVGGPYVIDVWVRPVGSTMSEAAYSVFAYTLTAGTCTSPMLTPSLPSPQVHGAAITFTASSSGCSYPEYLYYLKGPAANAPWIAVQGYGGATWSWNTSNVASIGTYTVDVWVRAKGSNVAEQAAALLSYTLT